MFIENLETPEKRQKTIRWEFQYFHSVSLGLALKEMANGKVD